MPTPLNSLRRQSLPTRPAPESGSYRGCVSILVTGAAGFIGSNLVRHLAEAWPERRIVALDALRYSGHRVNLEGLAAPLEVVDICDREAVDDVFGRHAVTGVIHLAAESHVDRSIAGPDAFLETNVRGTMTLLQAAADHGVERFHHVSTDEVFGSIDDGRFHEDSVYRPNSPYAASKAAADHFVRAWHVTYGLPVVISNSSNNYGPRQHPEKLVPTTILRAFAGAHVPLYGDGANVRDWIHVRDHCRALAAIYDRGRVGETYLVGADTPVDNRHLVETILDLVDAALGRPVGTSQELIELVKDRPGHDRRYAVDASKLETELGWEPTIGLTDGLQATVEWYRDNAGWVEAVRSDDHEAFTSEWYSDR